VNIGAAAVLGLGEAGSRLAADLAAAGVDVRRFDPDPARGGMAGSVEEAVDGAELVLSVNAASAARAVADAALPSLNDESVYADLNTAGPALKEELGNAVGERFADVALLGPVPDRGLATPVLASGPAAQRLADLLRPLGMPVEVVSERAGDAATMKLLRSVFMKGLAASAFESLAAAREAEHEPWLEEQIAAVIGRPLLERLVTGSRTHAARRVDEMEAARDLLVELDVEPRITNASAAVLAELSQIGLAEGGR
jgi:3-hydroxyisobutyrate dehydrogenase-like beta-hydroxyacid dehydrogenase